MTGIHRCASAAVLAALLAAQGASAAGPGDVCAAPLEQIVLPGKWMQVVTDGVVSYRHAASREALTTALYEFRSVVVDEHQRLTVAQKAVEMKRDAERRLAGASLVLSPERRRRAGALLHFCHTGADPDANRRFVSRTVVSPQGLQHFYYEAVGLTETAFGQRAGVIFGTAARTTAGFDLASPLGGAGSVRSGIPLVVPVATDLSLRR